MQRWQTRYAMPGEAYRHALQHGPSDDTRGKACEISYYAYLYALNVDGAPRDDTWEASKGSQSVYLQDVPGAIGLYFRDWLIKNRNSYYSMKIFCGWQKLFTKHHNMIKKLDIDAAVVYVLSIRRTK